MKGIDPKWAMYLGLLVTIEQAIGHGTVSLTNLVPGSWAPYITSWCNFLAFIGTAIMTYQAAVSSPMAGPAVNTPIAPAAKVAIFLIAALAVLSFSVPAHAQIKTPGQIKRDIDALGQKLNAGVQQQVAAVTKPADTATALPCMDISVLTKLTPQNLVPTLKGCEIAGVNQLVTDTSRALDSAKAFTGSATGTTASGDNDAINCLTPGLALFKAAAIIPAVPAILNADGTVQTPAVAEIDPGPILLFQKYREFTIVGGLTSCQTWLNGPVNATAAAGIAGVGAAMAGAALLPK